MTRRPENFTPAQRAAIFRRAKGHCEGCTRKLGVGGEKWEAHHRTGIWEGGRADVENGQALCVTCHAAVTRTQAGERAEARRHERKRAGIARQAKRPIPGSRTSGWKKPVNGPAVRRD